MKVLVLTPGVFDKGGIARYGRFQIQALREAFGDASVRVVSLMGRKPEDIEESFEAEWAGAVPHTWASRVHFSGVAIRLAARDRPSVVLSQHLNMGPLAWTVARMSGARLVQNIYGHEIWSGVSPARRFALRNSDLVIGDSHNSVARAKDLGIVSGEPAVVWDCVDLGRYTPGEPDVDALEPYGLHPKRRFRALFLARLQPYTRYKGSERLISLISQLPADRFEAVLAGKGDDLEHLRDVARQLGVADRVILTGGIHEAHMPHVYRSADAFYLVSEAGDKQGEGIPVTPIEAMACGVPVVVGNEDGSREILDGDGGICCAPHDLDGQAAYLTELADAPGRHRDERASARDRAESAFGYPAFAEKMVSALRSMAS